MTKLDSVYERVLDALADGEPWTLEPLLWVVNWHAPDLEAMCSMATLRRAVARLPEGCVTTQGRRLVVAARHFARTAEVLGALHGLDNWADDIPVLIERHKPTLRRALMLADDWALLKSLEWASAGEFEITHTVYGTMLRTRPFQGAKAS